jgi:outer membrane protein OmpA-like peptidoglycan-associated protein
MPAQPPGPLNPAVTPPPVVTADPKAEMPPVRPERPTAQKPPSEETTQVLEDQGKRDRKADARQAEKIEDKDDAKRLLMNILGVGAGGAVTQDRSNQPRPGDRPGDRFRQGYRPPVEEVGRTQQDRERNVGSMVQRFQGRSQPAPPLGSPSRDQQRFELSQTQRHTQFYEGNRRVVRYSSMQEIPPVIVASQRLNRVQVMPLSQSAYNVLPQGPPPGQYYNEVPQPYTANDAYAVSYSVDPSSAISRDDILFRQGSTDFADAYSYDLVIDVAEALNAPALLKETFVIEGHASAEGDYGQNLLLSQERAERISRELVRHGVSAERLMPVGYGETEAAHPANAAESERSLDRRVMVFRMR